MSKPEDDNNEVYTQEDLDTLHPPNTSLSYPSESEQAISGFTPLIVEEILKNLAVGLTLSDAAHIVKLPPSRLNQWYTNNFCNFKYAVDYQTTNFKRRNLVTLLKSENATTTRSAQFILERKFRDEYGKEIKIDVSHSLISNVTKVVFDTAVRHIKDPELLKIFINDLSDQLSLVKPTAEATNNQLLIT
jgi:hypothetical protein